MFDDTNNPVEETQVEQPEVQEPVAESAPVQAQQETAQAKSFRTLREKAEKAERERDEAIRILQEIHSRQQPQAPEEDYNVSLEADALAEGKHLSKLQKKINKLEEQIKSFHNQSGAIATEAKLKSQFPDFDKVVNKDTIEALKAEHPEIAHTLSSATDLYSQGASAYKLIKKLGIYQEDHYEADRALAQKNAAKPRPLASVSPQQGDSPLSHANAFANGLTPELQKNLWKEMQDIRKRS